MDQLKQEFDVTGKDLDLSGSLGGFHVLDITPEVPQYQQVFSVGYDSDEENSESSAPNQHSVMYKTAYESMFEDENESDTKALSFHFTRGIQRSKTMENFSVNMDETTDMEDIGNDQNISNLELHVASMCYIHSPRILHEIALCFSEFKEYMSVFAQSIKTAAAEVALEIISSKLDTSVMASKTVIGEFTSPDSKRSSATLFKQPSMNKQQSFYCPEYEDKTLDNVIPKLLFMNIQLATPVILFPRSTTSPQAFVAQLGQISISNCDLPQEELAGDGMEHIERNRMLMEMRDTNLCSVDLEHDLPEGWSISQCHKSFMHSLGDEFGIPVLHNTTIQMVVDYIQPDPTVTLPQEDTSAAGWCFGEHMFEESDQQKAPMVEEANNILDITAKIATPLKLELSKAVYEQLLQTIDNMTYSEHLAREQSSQNLSGQTQSSDNLESEIQDSASEESVPKPFPKSKSQSQEKFLTKRVTFEVPVFNVEMKGDFGEGEKGLVDLKLNNFLLNYEKSTNYCSNIDIHLKSLTVEDLLEDPDSPHRYLIMSRADAENEKSDKHIKFLSTSCPNSMIIAPTPIMPRSLPSSFHKELPPHTMLSPSVEQVPQPFVFLRKSRSSAVPVRYVVKVTFKVTQFHD